MNQMGFAFLLLRAAIASVFTYAAIGSIFTPQDWIIYFPLFLQHLLPQSILLGGFAIYELLLAVWLLSGKYTFFAAILSALTLSGIVIFNFESIDIVFRDIAIILSAASLAVFSYKK